MSKPTIVIVPGSWHTVECFGSLIKDLHDNGYECLPISLPSNQSAQYPEGATLTDDTTAVRTAVQGVLDQGNSVVVVAHSYGGVPTNNALEDLNEASRLAAGHDTAVVAVVFLCAAIVGKGTSFAGEFGGQPATIHKLHYPFVDVNEPGPAYYFYNDLPAEDAIKWSSKLQTTSWRAYEGLTTYSAVQDITSWYLHALLDNALVPPVQKYFVQRARDHGALLYDETIMELDAGHSPFLSQVGKTSNFVQRAATTRRPLRSQGEV